MNDFQVTYGMNRRLEHAIKDLVAAWQEAGLSISDRNHFLAFRVVQAYLVSRQATIVEEEAAPSAEAELAWKRWCETEGFECL